ncbi:MAG: cytochrome c peroxidase, partial [Emticicia sp.]|nr:cytochrome c peroxidase [Emticicia sp.]
MKNSIILLFLGISFLGCNNDEVNPDEPLKQLLVSPTHFSAMPTFPSNPTTVDGVILGRKLFFDPILSGNNRVSCETCHEQSRAFTDGVALSTRGQSGNPMHRNSPVLFNLAWANNGLFWDGGAKNLESLIIGPITHLDEMGQNVLDLPNELGGKDNYSQLFDKAFPNDSDKGITTPKVLKAIAQYIRTLNSANSKYDQYILNQTKLSESELNGLAIFKAKCASCHTTENHLFTDNAFHNNGLDDTFSDDFENANKGRYRITYREEDIGKFKTPSLRNLKFSAPYMHDGRFNTLNQVLNHYSSEIKKFPTLDKSLQDFTLSNQEKTALLAFLETLND